MAVHDLATRNGVDLAPEQDFSPRFVVSLDDLRGQIRALDDFKRSIMQQGSDFDVIPGTQKPTLLKPGAEKLVSAFGHVPHFRTVKEIQDWEAGFFYYQVECSLVNRRTGIETANGLGSCNTKEGRYRWRNTGPTCAACGHELMRSKQGGGWFCWQKKGGCGANYSADQVTGTSGRVENDDPYTLDNTVLKMAQKRALVAAVLVGFSASAIFTQDVEDYADVQASDVDVRPSGGTTPAIKNAAGQWEPLVRQTVNEAPPAPKAEVVEVAPPRARRQRPATLSEEAEARLLRAAKAGKDALSATSQDEVKAKAATAGLPGASQVQTDEQADQWVALLNDAMGSAPVPF